MPELDILQPGQIPDALRSLVLAAPMPGLGAGPQCPKTHAAITALLRDPRDAPSTSAPDTVHAGSLTASALWLLAGDLDASHAISQSNDTAEGSYWHGIMHRREGDFSNAKYWFRRVGQHEVHALLVAHIQAAATSLASELPLDRLDRPSSLAAELVDLCQASLRGQPQWRTDLEQICWWEWQLLLIAGLTAL